MTTKIVYGIHSHRKFSGLIVWQTGEQEQGWRYCTCETHHINGKIKNIHGFEPYRRARLLERENVLFSTKRMDSHRLIAHLSLNASYKAFNAKSNNMTWIQIPIKLKRIVIPLIYRSWYLFTIALPSGVVRNLLPLRCAGTSGHYNKTTIFKTHIN